MHTQYRCALEKRYGVEHGGAVERTGSIGLKQTRYHAFARYAHKQRQTELMQTFHSVHYAVVLLKRFAEAGFDAEADPLAPRTQYLRFKQILNWEGTTWLDLTEIQVYGDNR